MLFHHRFATQQGLPRSHQEGRQAVRRRGRNHPRERVAQLGGERHAVQPGDEAVDQAVAGKIVCAK